MGSFASLKEFKTLDCLATPVWLSRPVPGCPDLGFFWCNSAARQRLGPMLERSKAQAVVQNWPESLRGTFCVIADRLHDVVLVKGGILSHQIDPKTSLQHVFQSVSEKETMTNIFDSLFTFEIDGAGIEPDAFRLQDLLQHSDPGRCGAAKHTLYEMWPATDLVGLQQCLLVQSFNITLQKQLEMELDSAKSQLERQNQELQQSCIELKANEEKITHEKDQLAAQQKILEEHLKMALSPQMLLHTSVDTSTIAEKIVFTLDGLLEGRSPPLADVLRLRNSVLEADDLRVPIDLQDQLMFTAGLSKDVGLAMTEMLQGDSHSGAKRLEKRKLKRSDASKNLTASLANLQDIFDASRESGILEEPVQATVQSFSIDLKGSFRQCRSTYPDEVTLSITPQIERLLLEASTSFEFDAFELDEASNGQSLSMLAFFLIKGSGLTQQYKMSELRLTRFLQAIEDGYQNNCYHNRIHACCVLQVMHLLMHHGLIAAAVLPDLMVLACYLAAVCHDFQHPGVNNDFLIRSGDEKALIYNDASPLENHHVSASFMIAASDPLLSPLDNMSPEDRATVRASMIELILGTDMKKHFSLMSRFQTIQKPQPSDKPASDGTGALGDSSAEHKLLVAQVALKCSDIGHLACPLPLHQRWTAQLRDEFFSQGDLERKRGLRVSALMDRGDPSGMLKSQVGFFEIVALPMFSSYVSAMPQSQPLLDAVMKNYHYWHTLAKT
ncbi:hypothetical protein WJX84_000706 [Apatococcus fuscideae]|uniref:Phosphodiesterase n=1 Tax=Apatococcus fuscideae TaxID=2026836 RepID=A0AAW1T403_9CHLO